MSDQPQSAAIALSARWGHVLTTSAETNIRDKPGILTSYSWQSVRSRVQMDLIQWSHDAMGDIGQMSPNSTYRLRSQCTSNRFIHQAIGL